MSDEKIVNRDCINWSNNDHCAKTKSNYCVKDCKHYRVCGASPTIPASVASRLTDEQIESIAESLEYDAKNLYGDNTRLFMDDENNAAAVLRDYVRLRKLTNAIAVSVHDVDLEHMPDDDIDCINELSDVMKELKRLLAEAEKGAAR